MASDANGNYIDGTDASDFDFYPDGAPAMTSTSTPGNSGGGLSDWVSSLGSIGSGVLGTILTNKTAQAQAGAQNKQAQSNALISANTTKMLMIAGAVVSILTVVLLLFRRK